MAFDDKVTATSSDIGLFDIADWIWSFRWLAIAFVTLAAIWTGIIFWTASKVVPVNTSFVVTITIYPSGTPVRNATEISSILSSRLAAMNVRITSALGDSQVVVNVPTNEAVEKVISVAEKLEDDLTSDVQAQLNLLAPLMSNDYVPEYIAAQYVTDATFLAGQSGLFRLLDPVVSKRVSNSPEPNRMQLIQPWLFFGLAFGAIAGGITFARKWKEHLLRRNLKAGRE